MLTETKVKCTECGYEWPSQAKVENIEAGKIKCKAEGCECTDLKVVEMDKDSQVAIAELQEKLDAAETKADDAQLETKALQEQVDADAKEKEKLATPAKGTAQLQEEGDKYRRNQVDAKNKNAAANLKAEKEALAKTPLNAEEMAFCRAIEPRMNNGRRADAPCQADVLRFSKLRGRMGIQQTNE
jgi:hypothetical protein